MNQDPDEEAYSFIRKRTTIDRDGNLLGSVYQITTVQRTADGETVEQKRLVTGSQRHFISMLLFLNTLAQNNHRSGVQRGIQV